MRIGLARRWSNGPYEASLAKTGHEFFIPNYGEVFRHSGKTWISHAQWDERRPKPSNIHLVENLQDQLDILIGLDPNSVERLHSEARSTPLIFNCIWDPTLGTLPDVPLDHLHCVFLSNEVAERFFTVPPANRHVIPMGIDSDEFSGWIGDIPGILTTAGSVPLREDKGIENLVYVDAELGVTLAGPGNESLTCAIGCLPHQQLLLMYRRYQVYFNPSPVFGISLAEAMMAGMPIVTMETGNLKGVIRHGENGFICKTKEDAVEKIQHLLRWEALRERFSKAARETALRVFGLERFVSDWNLLLEKVRCR